jgi:hypothetical protein
MKYKVLMSYDEPTDIELNELMKEVAEEAKLKALMAKKNLSQKILNEIISVKERMKSKLP